MNQAMKRFLGALCLGSSLTLGISACGTTPPEDQGAGGSVVNAPLDKELHSQLPKGTASRGSIVMATDAGIGTPFATYDTSGEKIAGFDVDLGEALAHRLGLKLQVTQASFGSLIPGLQAGRYDFAASVIYDTKEREKAVDFVDYAEDGTGLLSSAGSSHKGLKISDFCGLTVATVPASTAIPLLNTQSTKCTAGGKKPATVKVLGSNAEALLAVTSGRVDVTTGDALQYAYLAKNQPGKFQTAGTPLDTGIDALAFPKGSKLAPVMQKALQKMMADGSYKKLMAQYGFTGGELGQATMNKAPF